MTILSAQTIKKRGLVTPLKPSYKIHGMSAGLSCCGVDLTLGEDIIIPPKTQVNSFVNEYVNLPHDLRGKIENKSTLARMGIDASATTNAEPGWKGYLTIEIYNRTWWFKSLKKGTPIVQIVFEMLDQPTISPYNGKYQGQEKRTYNAILERV